MFSARFLFPALPLPAPACTPPTFLPLRGMIDSLEVHQLLQRSMFGSIPGGNGDGDGDGHGHGDGGGGGGGDGDGRLTGGLQHGPVVACLLQLSALGAQIWDLRDLGLISFQLHGKLNENRSVPAFSPLTGATRKMMAAALMGWGATRGEVLGMSLNKQRYLERAPQVKQGRSWADNATGSMWGGSREAARTRKECQLAKRAPSWGSVSAGIKGDLPGVKLSKTLQRK